MADHTLLTIILNYKTPDMTVDAVAAALREMQGIAGEIIVVDNDSQDGSFEKMCAQVTGKGWDRDGRVRLVQSGHNGGFGAGNNVGIRAGFADGTAPDLVYVLNSDAFPDKGAIRALIDCLDTNPQAGFAGSYIHGPDGDTHVTAFRFPSIASEFEGAVRLGLVSRFLGKYAVPLPVPAQTCAVDWLAGASLMMRRTVLDRIGLFDEAFFLYFEETDLCLRARRAGWQTIYVRESRVTHIGSVSTGMKTWARVPDYWYDSRLHYFVKNHGIAYATAATLAHLAGGVLWRLRRVLQRKPHADPPGFLSHLAGHYLKALAQGALRKTGSGSDAAPRTKHIAGKSGV